MIELGQGGAMHLIGMGLETITREAFTWAVTGTGNIDAALSGVFPTDRSFLTLDSVQWRAANALSAVPAGYGFLQANQNARFVCENFGGTGTIYIRGTAYRLMCPPKSLQFITQSIPFNSATEATVDTTISTVNISKALHLITKHAGTGNVGKMLSGQLQSATAFRWTHVETPATGNVETAGAYIIER